MRLLCAVCLLGAVGSLAWTKIASEDHVYLLWTLGGTWNHVKVCMCDDWVLFLFFWLSRCLFWLIVLVLVCVRVPCHGLSKPGGGAIMIEVWK